MSAYLTIKEAAELAGVSPKTIRRYINRGLVVSKTTRGKRGMEYRVLKSSLFKHLSRMGYTDLAPATAEQDEGSLTVTLRKLVPRYLYDEVIAQRDQLLQEKGRLEGQLENHVSKLAEVGKKLERLNQIELERAKLQQRVQQLESDNQHLKEMEEMNKKLMQAMVEKDQLIKMLTTKN